MREIKFRAWDNKEIHYFGLHEVYGNDVYYDTGNGLDYSVGVHVRWTKCKLMQFTGLKDKNGVDIYEGDVIKVEGYPDIITEVIFSKGMFTGKISNYLYMVCDICNIIGNIYENPELIK